jgi:hypothetical protein
MAEDGAAGAGADDAVVLDAVRPEDGAPEDGSMVGDAPVLGDPETVMEGSTDSGGRPCAYAIEPRTAAGNMILETIFLNKQPIASSL